MGNSRCQLVSVHTSKTSMLILQSIYIYTLICMPCTSCEQALGLGCCSAAKNSDKNRASFCSGPRSPSLPRALAPLKVPDASSATRIKHV